MIAGCQSTTPHFGVHNCGWNVDAYAKAYSEIRTLGYLDFGIQSDLAALKRLFPGTVLTVILNPDDVIGRKLGEVVGTLERLRDSLHECRILLGSLDGRTSSAEVNAFFTAAADAWEVPVGSLSPAPILDRPLWTLLCVGQLAADILVRPVNRVDSAWTPAAWTGSTSKTAETASMSPWACGSSAHRWVSRDLSGRTSSASISAGW